MSSSFPVGGNCGAGADCRAGSSASGTVVLRRWMVRRDGRDIPLDDALGRDELCPDECAPDGAVARLPASDVVEAGWRGAAGRARRLDRCV